MMQAEPRVVLCSLWRNDAGRDLAARAAHLLDKSYADLRWLWLVGDSDDDTLDTLDALLRAIAVRRPQGRDPVRGGVTLAQYDTGILGGDMATRLARLSAMVNELLRRMRRDDDYVLMHESDLVSPVGVVERMVAHAGAGRQCIAGWPVIQLSKHEQLYDIWALRAQGRHFEAWPPYHAVYRADAPFEVDSFGSVYMFPAAAVRGGIPGLREGAVGICEHLRARGHRMWVDPTLRVVQPVALWEPA